jgi:ABC-type multidrug transport system fused ATPase/permease subunit
MKISRGDRITLIGSHNSGKRVVILALYRLFSMEHMSGQVLINNIDIYEERISRECLEKLIYAIPNTINVYFGPTVILHIQKLYPEETA